MAQVEYVGPIDEVIVVEADDAVVRRGETIEVSEDLAARLLEQPDNWRRPTPSPTRPGRAAAAPARPAEEESAAA